MATNVDLVSKTVLFGRNATRWISSAYDIPREELFVQWVLRNDTAGFKAMVKRAGTETYYEVTHLSESPGYDITCFEKKDSRHVT